MNEQQSSVTDNQDVSDTQSAGNSGPNQSSDGGNNKTVSDCDDSSAFDTSISTGIQDTIISSKSTEGYSINVANDDVHHDNPREDVVPQESSSNNSETIATMDVELVDLSSDDETGDQVNDRIQTITDSPLSSSLSVDSSSSENILNVMSRAHHKDSRSVLSSKGQNDNQRLSSRQTNLTNQWSPEAPVMIQSPMNRTFEEDSHLAIVRNGNISHNRRVILPKQTIRNNNYGRRRDLREIMDDSELEWSTLKAQRNEEKRLKRIRERSALKNKNRSLTGKKYEDVLLSDDDFDLDGNEFFGTNNSGVHIDDRRNKPDKHGRVLINVNRPSDEKPIFLPQHLTKIVKPHQIGGLRFLYDNIIDNLADFKRSPGYGCILAHSMGLGKTFQVVAFVDIFLTHTPAKTVLCIVPVNTLKNWLHEFNMWLPSVKKSESKENPDAKPRKLKIFSIRGDTHKDLTSRAKEIKKWREKGGVLVMGYEMYRILTVDDEDEDDVKRRSSRPPRTDEWREESPVLRAALVNPGPDLVICDEGHKIKNHKARTSKALKKIKTQRRVVLTGYPLQNNLFEYWCMVDFVRPNFLGTRYEFQTQFEAPITNGQCLDSTAEDQRLMRERAHVLHKLLRGFVQRRSHTILKNTLPTKHEHVILVKMTELQRDLMLAFLEKLRRDIQAHLLNANSRLNPIIVFAVFCKVWNHPDIVYKVAKEDGLIVDTDVDFGNTDAIDDDSMMGNGKLSLRKIDYRWALDPLRGYKPGTMENGPKFVIFFEILEKTLQAGDKLLVFSHSLFTLDLLEKFLAERYVPSSGKRKQKWSKFVNYFRLDGSTGAEERESYINQFNKSKEYKLFLLSTKAGSLGINLTSANRIVVFDASWNPCHDAQAACRIFRYGQQKESYIYRLVCDTSLEKKIYDRQINKQAVADRVVDDLNPDGYLTKNEIERLMHDLDQIDLLPTPIYSEEDLKNISDDMVKHLCRKFGQYLTSLPFEHESLLLDRIETKLSASEKRVAEENYLRARKQTEHSFHERSFSLPYDTAEMMETVTNFNLPSQIPAFSNCLFNGKKEDEDKKEIIDISI